MGWGKDFKQFAVKGNVVDLAVGIVIGAAFGKIVSSFVNHVVMPPIGLLLGGMDFGYLGVTLKGESVDAAGNMVPAVRMAYGAFINTLIDFVIIAFAIFLLVKAINQMKRREEVKAAAAPAPAPSREEQVLVEIRDILRAAEPPRK